MRCSISWLHLLKRDILSSFPVCLDDRGRKIKLVCLVILGNKVLAQDWISLLLLLMKINFSIYLKKDMVSERHLSYSPLMVILWMGEAVILMVFGIPNEQTPLQGSGKLIQWSFCLNRFTWSFKVGFSTNIQLTFISWSIHILVFPLCFSDYLFFRKCFKCFFAGLHFGSWVFAKQETLKVAHSGLNQLQFCF